MINQSCPAQHTVGSLQCKQGIDVDLPMCRVLTN